MAGCERILEYLGRGHWHQRPSSHKAIHGHWANLADWVTLSQYPRTQRAGLKKSGGGLTNGESVILLYGIYATRLRPVWQ